MNAHRYRPFYYLSFIAIPFFIIYIILAIIFTDTNPFFTLYCGRLAASGLAFIFSIIVVFKNKEEKLFQLFSISIACLFMGDIYILLHNSIYGVSLEYFFVYLAFFATIAFMTLILVGLLKRTKPVNNYLPLLGIIPVIIISILIWMVGKIPLTTIIFIIIVSVAAYYICKLLMSNIGKHFIFFVCCFIIYTLFVLAVILFFTIKTNLTLMLVIEGIFVLLPLLFLPAFGMGLEKCQK